MHGERDRSRPTKITDPRAVAALTHPLRMRLLAELSRRRSARAVDLAGVVEEPPNSVSFHLRQLAKYGLIEEDRDHGGDGRERWWRQTSDRGFEIDLEALREREGGDAAVDTIRRVAEGHVLAVHRAINSPAATRKQPERHQARRRPTVSDDFAVRLTDTEFEQMTQDLQRVLDHWADVSREASTADDGQQRHSYYGVLMGAPAADIEAIYFAQQEQQP